jgi:hypothetical protein
MSEPGGTMNTLINILDDFFIVFAAAVVAGTVAVSVHGYFHNNLKNNATAKAHKPVFHNQSSQTGELLLMKTLFFDGPVIGIP